IVFANIDGELNKFVLRPHQMRAADKVVERAKDPTKRRALVWHTQGSGKTYTMITAAKLLIDDPALEHPTVVVLIDRIELETQMATISKRLASVMSGPRNRRRISKGSCARTGAGSSSR